jgi:hypothetical protein
MKQNQKHDKYLILNGHLLIIPDPPDLPPVAGEEQRGAHLPPRYAIMLTSFLVASLGMVWWWWWS